jgi:superoxide reductase
MSKQLEVYKCEICGAITEVLQGGEGELVCCNEPMILLKENTVDAAKEKHVPVIEKTADGIVVKIGTVPHPMEEKHYIQWIELVTNDKVYRQQLSPGDKPEACFPKVAGPLSAREHCNLHGLWAAKE